LCSLQVAEDSVSLKLYDAIKTTTAFGSFSKTTKYKAIAHMWDVALREPHLDTPTAQDGVGAPLPLALGRSCVRDEVPY